MKKLVLVLMTALALPLLGVSAEDAEDAKKNEHKLMTQYGADYDAFWTAITSKVDTEFEALWTVITRIAGHFSGFRRNGCPDWS